MVTERGKFVLRMKEERRKKREGDRLATYRRETFVSGPRCLSLNDEKQTCQLVIGGIRTQHRFPLPPWKARLTRHRSLSLSYFISDEEAATRRLPRHLITSIV